jgi:predicted RecA/RadA family phage recombinase
MAECTFKHGNPTHIDYTPSGGNVAAGEVVVQGTVTGNTAGYGLMAAIASVPITNSTKGALAIGGVWECTNLNNAATGAVVYWEDSANKVTTVSTNNAQFGIIVLNGGGGANTACWVLHDPVPVYAVS